jgi:hypothetical protein
MGIYYDNKIYGVKITNAHTVLYKKIYDNEITPEEKEEAKKMYNELRSKNDLIYLYVYVECTTTFDSPPVTEMVWANYNFDEL